MKTIATLIVICTLSVTAYSQNDNKEELQQQLEKMKEATEKWGEEMERRLEVFEETADEWSEEEREECQAGRDQHSRP